MRTDDFFEALSEIDDELIANAGPVRSPDEIVVRRAPLWKTIAGYAAAAACVAALAVGGIFGIKYFNGRNAVTPPASGTSGADGNTSISKSDCMAFVPAEYPPEAKYVYEGDYGELDYSDSICVDYVYFPSYEALAYKSDLIVSGQFTDHAHQTAPVDKDNIDPYSYYSYNTFYIDKVIKGDKKTGDAIAIGQRTVVWQGMIYSYSLSPMICGDRWVYFLKKSDDGYYYPVSHLQGRYPLPFNQNKALKECGDYGYYGNDNHIDCQSAVYLQALNEFGLAVTQNFDGVILSVMTDKNSYKQGEEIKVTATVLNTTDKPIGLLMPCQGEGSHTEISTWIERAERYLPDISVTGGFDTAMGSHIVEPYGEYVQEMTFGTSYTYYEKSEAAMPGTYRGTAAICLLAEPNDTGSECTVHKINFELEITGDKNIQPPVEKIADYYGGQIPEDSIKFTMPEFPGTEFEFKREGVYANGEQMFGGITVYSVYLCDLNGDGKREIISCCRNTNYKSLESDFIKICDYADGGKLYRFVDDPFFYDDHLTIKDGSLIVVRTTKPGYSTEPEDILQPLTFDRLEAYYVRSENAPAPVKNYYRIDDFSRHGGMEDFRLFFLDYYCENENEPVYSTVNGTVDDIGYSIRFGQYVSVIGEDGCYYYFGSLKIAELSVNVGDKITAGQQIGIVGSSGDWPMGTLGVKYCCSYDKVKLSM